MNIVGVIRFNAPFIFGMLTVLFIVVKITVLAKTVGKIIRSTKNHRRVISQMLGKDDAENLI